MIDFNTLFEILITAVSISCSKGAIDGSFSPHRTLAHDGQDPCNPLYWYPRSIPEYCYYKNSPTPKPNVQPIPLPIPVPLPPRPLSIPPLMYPPSVPPNGPPGIPPLMIPPGLSFPLFPPRMPSAMKPPNMPPDLADQFIPPGSTIPEYPLSPQGIFSLMPGIPPQLSPYGMPNTMISVPGVPYQQPYPLVPQRQVGLVPGIPGLVTQDGGINILPFSDVYSDVLERHKQKMARKRLEKLLEKYDRYPWKRHRIRKY